MLQQRLSIQDTTSNFNLILRQLQNERQKNAELMLDIKAIKKQTTTTRYNEVIAENELYKQQLVNMRTEYNNSMRQATP